MLFSLANIKRRSVRDPDGELAVVPKLLHGRTDLKLVGQAIEVFDSYAGRTRAAYDPRALEAVLADYRLARCVEACLLTYYSFVQPQLSDALDPEQVEGLAARRLASASDMRLALWDEANARYGGFVPSREREAVLVSLAGDWGLPPDVALVDRLLNLDSEGVAVLTPKGARPTPPEIVRLYNRGVVQTLLAHSTRVEVDVSRLPGAALKRLYFLAKRRGVLVEIEESRTGYRLTLFGYEQAFGSAEKYGQQLAEVALSLLRSLLASGEEGEAAVTAYLLLHDRPYRFHITEETLARLEYGPEKPRPVRGVAESGAAYSVGGSIEGPAEDAGEEPNFDSMVEAGFYREHKSLEKGGYTHGWGIEREPDPLLAPGIVLIPDFAFRRGDTRVFMEIAGFWSPSYRERKLSKLRSLAAQSRDEVALVIAAPNDAAPVFAGLPYPLVPYKNKVRATDVLAVLDERYGAREERLQAAESQVDALRSRASSGGFVAESEVAAALQTYTRSELLASAQSLGGEGVRYVPGVGLLSEARIDSLREALAAALNQAGGRLDLDSASRAVSSQLGGQTDIESLLQLWPDWHIERPSLFEALIVEG